MSLRDEIEGGRRCNPQEFGEMMRFFGVFFLALALAALAWDAYAVLTGYGVRSLAGILHIWLTLHEASYKAFEAATMSNVGYDVWTYMIVPVMSVPAFALFGVPGVLMLRQQNREIKARAPSLAELEMMRQGMDPRKTRRR